MAEHGGGGDSGPVFVDAYGTARRLGMDVHGTGSGGGAHGFEGPHPDGPFWRRGLKGELPLWVAFWGGFFFGHGIILAFSVGTLLFGTVFGMAIDPERLDTSIITGWTVGAAIGGVLTIFALWSVISVWRCAKNAEEKKWGVIARLVVLGYLAVWGITIKNLLT